MISANLQRFLKIVAVAAVALSLSRFVFFLNDYDTFITTGWKDLSIAFLHGIRFDLVTIAYGFVPLWLWMLLIPNKWPKAFNFIFLAILGLATFSNSIDTEFFRFTAKRMTSDIFRFIFLSNDVYNIGVEILLSFWYLVVSWVIINSISFVLVIRKGAILPDSINNSRVVPRIVMILLVILMMRGGVQRYPLSVHHASSFGNPANAVLVLNSPFTYIKSLGAKPLLEEKFMTPEAAKAVFDPVLRPTINEWYGIHEGKNVVILIVESLSKEYCGSINGKTKGYTPFLDSLGGAGLFLTNAYANGYRSITGIPAILSSLPTMMYEPIVTSGFITNDIQGLPEYLAPLGYSSYFFHGGNPGTMGFESYCNTAGFEHYFDREDYPDQQHYDGQWGIYDHQFLRYTVDRLSQAKEPFVASAFTLSSHHPYAIPEEFQNRFPKGELDIHESIGYADHSLRLFFEHAKKQLWYQNTLFVITTDHTSLTEGGFYRHYAGKLSIPIVFYAPSDTTLVGRYDHVAAQVDIVPSALHLLGYDKPVVSFGRSIFNQNSPHQSIMFAKHQYQIIKDDVMLRFNGKANTTMYDLRVDSLLESNLYGTHSALADSMETVLKAYVQQFADKMYSNRMATLDE